MEIFSDSTAMLATTLDKTYRLPDSMNIIAVEISLDAVGNSAGSLRSGQIKLVSQDGKRSINIKTDGFSPRGMINWQGNLPVSSLFSLQVKLAGCAIGDFYSINFMLATKSEAIGLSGSPNQNAVAVYPSGWQVPYEQVGAIDALVLTVQPPTGQIWVIKKLHAFHDDATARVISIRASNGVNVISLAVSSSIAAGVLAELYSVSLPENITITNDCYITVIIAALTAGNKMTVRAFYEAYGVQLG